MRTLLLVFVTLIFGACNHESEPQTISNYAGTQDAQGSEAMAGNLAQGP